MQGARHTRDAGLRKGQGFDHPIRPQVLNIEVKESHRQQSTKLERHDYLHRRYLDSEGLIDSKTGTFQNPIRFREMAHR